MYFHILPLIKKKIAQNCVKFRIFLFCHLLKILIPLLCLGTSFSSPAAPNNKVEIEKICSQLKSESARQFCIDSAKSKDLQKLSADNIAKMLGWVCSPNKNLCGGNYEDPPNIAGHPNPPPAQAMPTTITAKGGGVFTEYGTSILTGDVNITQTGRAIVANRSTVIRNKEGQITDIDLRGDVQLHEYGKTIIAKSGHLDLQHKTTTINDAIYRITTPPELGSLSVWGHAKKIFRDNKTGILQFFKASYSACIPTKQTWYITSSHLTLDKNTGRGTATNVVTHFKNIPVNYLPYISFPIDNRRKSGFLYPTFGNSNQSGFIFGLPYYLNLAPNYDLTLTPEIYSKRGVFTDAFFRYLTERNHGFMRVGYIPHDTAFSNFKQSAPNTYSPSLYPPNNYPSTAHALHDLENSGNNRGFFAYSNQFNINSQWKSNLDLSYVSDDYFQQDYFQIPGNLASDQIFSQANINYNSEHWNFLGRFLTFQTLHPLTYQQGSTDQYMRLPQLDLGANYPNEALGLSYQINSEFVRFDHRKNYIPSAPNYVIGDRFNIDTNVSLPLQGSSSYITPKLDLTAINYSLTDQQPNLPTNLTNVIPQLSIDSGLFFNRNMSFLGKQYTQSLEPRLYYLYVPVRNQNLVPVFDTTLPALNLESLFRSNRFAGIDRIGDANQIGLILTTRFLDDYSGQEKASASIGQVYAFHQHEVICPNNVAGISCAPDPLAVNKLSPILGNINYFVNPLWDLSADIAWNQTTRTFDNGALTVKYHAPNNQLINIGYNYIKDGDQYNQQTKNLNRIDLSFAWPFLQNWNLIGDWNYNLSYIHPQTYFYGLEYESCCFAIRLLQGKTFTGVNPGNNNDPKFDTQIFMQFLFKGLGAAGTAGTGDFIKGRISNYQDNFTGNHIK